LSKFTIITPYVSGMLKGQIEVSMRGYSKPSIIKAWIDYSHRKSMEKIEKKMKNIILKKELDDD